MSTLIFVHGFSMVVYAKDTDLTADEIIAAEEAAKKETQANQEKFFANVCHGVGSFGKSTVGGAVFVVKKTSDGIFFVVKKIGGGVAIIGKKVGHKATMVGKKVGQGAAMVGKKVGQGATAVGKGVAKVFPTKKKIEKVDNWIKTTLW